MPAHYRYLTFANMFGVLLLDPNTTDSIALKEKPHFHKLLLHLDRLRPLFLKSFPLMYDF